MEINKLITITVYYIVFIRTEVNCAPNKMTFKVRCLREIQGKVLSRMIISTVCLTINLHFLPTMVMSKLFHRPDSYCL